jgi:hypothetical protein
MVSPRYFFLLQPCLVCFTHSSTVSVPMTPPLHQHYRILLYQLHRQHFQLPTPAHQFIPLLPALTRSYPPFHYKP